MTQPTYRVRRGSVHGVKHAKLGVNNQDAALTHEFTVPKWDKSYRVGLVSDGCSGIPAFSYTEVGAHLLTVFCLGRTQELILGGAKMQEIPLALYHAVTSFLRDLANTLAPGNLYWPYPVQFPKGSHEFRNQLQAPQRFMVDYLAATILGFVDDGETLVTFQAGDGVTIVNGEVFVVDQDDRPDYPALSVNSPGQGFQVQPYASADVRRIGLFTDGIEQLLELPELGLPSRLFEHAAHDPMGLQFLLNQLRKQHGEKMGDDCTGVTMVRMEEGEQ